MKTFVPTAEQVKNDWYVIDATGLVLGRLAAQIAHRLRGKHKPEFAFNVDNGDFIIVVNCDKMKVTGTKLESKNYYRHSKWVGGLKTTALKDMDFADALVAAVRGMLPKSRLGAAQLKKLKAYVGAEHPHKAQAPKPLTLPY